MKENEVLTLSDFRALYPWPGEMLALGEPLEWLWRYDLDAPADVLWLHIVDTSRFNRALGMAEMQFEERDGALHGRSRNGGLVHEWVEDPWDWVAGSHAACVRRYSRGWGKIGRGIYHLQRVGDEGGERVRLYVYFGWIPRGLLGALVLRIGMPMIARLYRRVIDELAADIARVRPVVYEQPPPSPADDTLARVSAIGAALRDRGLDAAAVDRLVDLVCTGDDLDVYRLQVRALSRAWDVDEDALLAVFLHATRLGLLDLSWDVICPHCRGVRDEARHLGDVPALGDCDVCGIDFATDKENSIEITFHVHASIRDVPRRYFCSAEPASKMHIKLQRAVDPGERASVRLRLDPGRYRLRLAGQSRHRFLDVTSAADAATAPGELRWIASADGDAAVAPAPDAGPHVQIELVNDTDLLRTFVIETASWADVALRPARLFSFQEFRDLFSEEYLAADVQLAVGEQTILFTDVVGSTAFYSTRGDPAAFVEIKKHFTEVFDVIGSCRGAVVKTIGDAAMGAFSSPVDALCAARQIHERFHAGRGDTPIRVRVSLHTGPCIAVNLNSGVDYFGSTVNLAAKLQACAGAGEIALSEDTYAAPGVSELLAGEAANLERVTLESASVGRSVPAWRWRIYAATSPRDAVSSRDGAAGSAD